MHGGGLLLLIAKGDSMTSNSYPNVGLIQFLLASVFVVWLVFLPQFVRRFAWQIGDRLFAIFIGSSFSLRAFEGYFMGREPNWSRIRWHSSLLFSLRLTGIMT